MKRQKAIQFLGSVSHLGNTDWESYDDIDLFAQMKHLGMIWDEDKQRWINPILQAFVAIMPPLGEREYNTGSWRRYVDPDQDNYEGDVNW